MLIKYLMINSHVSSYSLWTVIWICILHKTTFSLNFYLFIKVWLFYYLPPHPHPIGFAKYCQVIISVNLETDCVNQSKS